MAAPTDSSRNKNSANSSKQLSSKATPRFENGHHSKSVSSGSPERTGYSTYYYLSPEAARAIPQYQYRGEDRSLLYKYILSPLAQFLVDQCTPKTLAPNSITLLGLTLMLASYLIFWWYVPSLQVPQLLSSQEATEDDNTVSIPRWTHLLNCAAMLTYQTLDNMDGKQARKTKSSSPLGLLFDHGCDAVNSIFGSANWIVAMGMHLWDDAFPCWFLVVGPYALFYIATWEEYYTGELILPVANGPNEGLFGGAMLSLTTYFFGIEFWQGHSWFDSFILPLLSQLIPSSMFSGFRIRNSDIIVVLSYVGILQEIILKSASVARKYGGKALLDVLPFTIVSLATLVIGWCDKRVLLERPRTSLHLMACLFVEMVTELMRAHISNQKFQPMQRWIILPLVLLAGAVAAMTLLGSMDASLALVHEYLIIYTTAACTYLAMKLVIVIDEICRVLNIWCCDIITPRKIYEDRYTMINGSHPKKNE